MKRMFGIGVAVLLCLPPTAGMAGTFSGIVVTVEAGPGADELTLHWSGGLAPYTVYRSTTPAMVESLSSLLAQTSLLSWTDLPPPGDGFFYEVTGTGCADGSAEQVFSSLMQGCAGAIPFANRNALCAAGCNVCSAQEWVANRSSGAPTHNYWTSDNLGYTSGSVSNNCIVSPFPPAISCQSAGFSGPMLVCGPAQPDSEANFCNIINCGLMTNSPQYFGGCARTNTAGAICCCP